MPCKHAPMDRWFATGVWGSKSSRCIVTVTIPSNEKRSFNFCSVALKFTVTGRPLIRFLSIFIIFPTNCFVISKKLRYALLYAAICINHNIRNKPTSVIMSACHAQITKPLQKKKWKKKRNCSENRTPFCCWRCRLVHSFRLFSDTTIFHRDEM